MTAPDFFTSPAPRGATVERGYLPIAAYGIIGDLRTAALVGVNGAIDWCCFPDFASPALFAALLDSGRGGRFRIAPAAPHAAEQRYVADTNVLCTTYRDGAGAEVELCDLMPIAADGRRGRFAEIHRRVTGVAGRMDLVVTFAPRFDFAAGAVRLIARRHGVLATDDDDEAVALAAPPEIWWMLEGDTACARLTVSEGETLWFVLRYDDDEVLPVASYRCAERLAETTAFWGEWVAKLSYEGRHRAEVVRSALALKLLCYEPTGAIVAAPTTSLPEEIGGSRNWDYRFLWLRDASFTLQALNTVGHLDEADAFMRFLRRVTRRRAASHVQIMYGIDGTRDLTERTLPYLEGYRGSRPVRVGNAAFEQLQLDVYGEVLSTAYTWSRAHAVGEGTWMSLRHMVDWVAAHWPEPDSGIWEVRAGAQQYVFSKVMCWVALDRGIRLAEEFALPADRDGWCAARDAVWHDVMTRGWSERRQSFVQAYGSDALDASNLLIPMVGFLPPDHPRVRATALAALAGLTDAAQELVYRYCGDDGLAGDEGVFSICTFWLAHALVLCGEREHGVRIFERMLARANHLGLYSEELDAATGGFLGNFPQAFTHIALINCAHALAAREPVRTRAGTPASALPHPASGTPSAATGRPPAASAGTTDAAPFG